VLIDLDRGEIIDIPNLMYEVFCYNQNVNSTIDELKKHFNYEYSHGIDKIIEFCLNKKLGFLTEEPEIFHDINLFFETPYLLTNAVIEYSNNSHYSIENVISWLNEYGCQAIEIRLLGKYPENFVTNLMNKFNNSRITKFDIVLKFSEKIDVVLFSKNMFSKHPRIASFIFYSTPKGLEKKEFVHNKTISLISIDVESKFIEKKTRNSFSCSLIAFSEAQSYNLGLNKKISINRFGKLKNYLTHEEEFGDVTQESIRCFTENVYLQNKWEISNNNIETCKDCQYRYVCVDNSPISQRNGLYYRANPCDFDPYHNLWI
jgi:SPASM domain peptide maturase of grasp-with-spasm system